MNKISETLKTRYGLPEEVVFCKRCTLSNQRPTSTPEFINTPDRIIKTLHIDEEGVCDPCRYLEQKENINWDQREKELLFLLDKHRRNDGYYDCIVPGSGGKDSCYASHILKYKYGMHPLTVTWPPMIYTDIGWKNFRRWIDIGGFDNISFNYNGKIHSLLTKISIENLLHPFQPFILGQKNLAPKIAVKYNIPLVFYGENEAEYQNPIADNETSMRNRSFYAMKNLNEIFLGGVSVKELFEKYKLTLHDIQSYLPPDVPELEKTKVEVHYLGYYTKWTPQEAFYYATENCGFQVNPSRTEGTYTKYISLDDRIDGFNYYTMYIKFGLGRTTIESSQEIRNKHLTREEAVALVRRFDGEFPMQYFHEIMDFIGMKPDYFHELCDKFRPPHLWKKENGDWKLRHKIS